MTAAEAWLTHCKNPGFPADLEGLTDVDLGIKSVLALDKRVRAMNRGAPKGHEITPREGQMLGTIEDLSPYILLDRIDWLCWSDFWYAVDADVLLTCDRTFFRVLELVREHLRAPAEIHLLDRNRPSAVGELRKALQTAS